MSSTNGTNGNKPEWIEIRDARGRLIFKYSPSHNAIEIKPHSSEVYMLIKLDEIRLKHGYTPEDLNIVFVQEYVVIDNTNLRTSPKPFSDNGK